MFGFYVTSGNKMSIRAPSNHLRVAVFQEEPFVMLKETSTGSKFVGFCVDLLEELKKTMDFEYILHETPDRKSGNALGNGSWDGVIGEITKGNADLATGSLTITSQREDVVDFTKPFMEYGIVMVMRRSEDTERDTFAFVHPFSGIVWAGIIASMFAVGILLYLTSRARYRLGVQSYHADNDRDFNLRNSLWFAYWSLMRKGGEPPPRSPSARIITGVWWLFALIVVSTYTANLTAFLTVRHLSVPVSSVEDLAAQSSILYGITDKGSLLDFFKNQEGTNSVYERLWHAMKARPAESFVSSVNEGMQRVLTSNYIFMVHHPYFQNRARSDTDCRLATAGAPFLYRGYGIATQNNSPWTEKLSLEILRLRESGRIDLLRDTWWPRSSCSTDGTRKDASARELAMADFIGIFYLLAGGSVLGCVVAALEILWCRFRGFKTKGVEDIEEGNLQELMRGFSSGQYAILIQRNTYSQRHCSCLNNANTDTTRL
ncbi:GRIK1 [Branchiostoma lanceolatum]|uniref:GRIK1 protein n=1 Tax=Branchiostoma lanceolatum TaxID=7740 RepID=A0A8J9YR72_BRALA|nr:GRIK1 [Branchiostoma lanceolatum]